MLTLPWPAILLASMELAPTSCRQVMFARRSECKPKPGKSHPVVLVEILRALRTPESPHRAKSIFILREDPVIGFCDLLLPNPLLITCTQVAQREYATAVLG